MHLKLPGVGGSRQGSSRHRGQQNQNKTKQNKKTLKIANGNLNWWKWVSSRVNRDMDKEKTKGATGESLIQRHAGWNLSEFESIPHPKALGPRPLRETLKSPKI